MTSPALVRQPKGQPTGGQFAAKSNPESDLELTLDDQAPDLAVVAPSEPPPTVTFAGIEKTERIKAMHSEIEHAITEMSDHDGWQRFLDSTSKFHRYSFGNAILIAMQRRDATVVAGFNDWRNKHNRTVKKGEKAIWILAPIVKKEKAVDGDPDSPERKRVVGFRSVPVFDVSQTEGEPLPENPALPVNELAPGEAPAGMVDNLTGLLADNGFTVERGDTGSANGYTRFSEHRVVISDKLTDRQAAKTLAHEAAHVMLGHGDRIHEYHMGGGRSDMEVEAESVAYVVSRYWGIDDAGDYSFGYIDSWAAGNPEKVKKTAESVVKAARAILQDPLPAAS